MTEAQSAHILLVDDDERIRTLLQKFLIRNNYITTVARNAAHARKLMAGLQFDILIVDVMMPGESGLSLCRDVTSEQETPVILLTAKGETTDRVAGLEAGADDYIAKPFEPKELLLRIAAVLRRVPMGEPTPQAKILHLGAVRYDIERGELLQGEHAIRLTATEGALMRIFARCPGEAVSRIALVEHLMRDGMKSQERAIDVQITRLRRKIEADSKQPRYLQTVRGAGYMLTCD